MRIGIDCLLFDSSYVGGLNTYVIGLIGAFLERPRGHTFTIFCTRRNRATFAQFEGFSAASICQVSREKGVTSRLLKLWALLLRDERAWTSGANREMLLAKGEISARCDILYSPLTTLTCFDLPIPTILSMHDIQHVHHPEFFTWKERALRRVQFNASAMAATYIQSSSAYTRNDILAYYKCRSADDIIVIHEGVDVAAFSAPPRVDVRAKYGLPDKFLFFPAQLWPHKNHIRLLNALRSIYAKNETKIPLVMTGGGFSAGSQVLNYIAAKKMDYVRYLGKVPFDELEGLYHQAWFLIMPTLHESSSLPILEAAAAGLPILASDIPPIREQAQYLAVNTFDPYNEESIAACILRHWSDEKLRRNQVAQNRLGVRRFAWCEVASKYLEFVESVEET